MTDHVVNYYIDWRDKSITLHFVHNQITNLCQDGLNFVKTIHTFSLK